MKLLGITGKAGSGKDELAKYLWEEHDFTRMAFADPLRSAARHIFGLSWDQMTNRDVKEKTLNRWKLSPRQILQRLGTESIRDVFGPDVWVTRWQIGYDLIKDTDNVVVTDVRFDNEAEAIRANGGIIIQIIRPGINPVAEHSSEAGLSKPADFIIENDGTLPDLYVKIVDLMENF